MIVSFLLLSVIAADDAQQVQAVIGAKAFPESGLLSTIASQLGKQQGISVRTKEFVGTVVAWKALLAGEIDIYPEYTGTLRQEIFARDDLVDDDALRKKLEELGILMTAPLGFNNSYALGMQEEVAAQLGITKISDLKQHPSLSLAVSNEFGNREDGWLGLRTRYGLPQSSVNGMEHAFAYRALDSRQADVMDVYTTDANIRRFDLRVLADDLRFFPTYYGVFVYRRDLQERAPAFVAAVQRLEGLIDDETMLGLNERAELDRVSVPRVAADFLFEALDERVEVEEEGLVKRVTKRTLEHSLLVGIALTMAILVAVPLGILAAKFRVAGQLILAVAEVIQTVPSLALLSFVGVFFLMINLPMTGPVPAIAALFLYALLPIIRNTVAGLASVPNPLKESAIALGLPALARLRLIELPMASQMIFAGIKTTAVITVGFAALGGFIGAGGYGRPIIAGMQLVHVPTMMEGAVPAALMAMLVKGGFEASERWLVPKGLRLAAPHS